jgi:anaerobic magnesium-protoporphyrin IX monomethyl ester cyclase
MKVVICTVPMRPDKIKTNYPPIGAMAIIQSLRSAGYDPDFYDINVFRPSEEEERDYFLKNKYDVVGISASVSASYRYVKRLVNIIKSVSPETVVVVGGRLAASSEVILRFSPIDFCVIGEGENIAVNLLNYISRYGNKKDDEELGKIKGLCFVNSGNSAVFTGYDTQPSIEEIRDPDYSILERYSDINNYIIDPLFYEQFGYDERALTERRKGKRLATVATSRGCVNRCTFCHRWQKGIRIFPVDRVINNIRGMIDRYNVGFISFGDENFGATRKWMEEFIEKIKPLDILYRVAGICCENVDPQVLRRLKDSGCVAVHFGFESGSDRMLKAMEKRADVETNVKVAAWIHEAGLQTVPALVVGLPGESFKTIDETSDFIKRITGFLPRLPVVSANLLIALPGTPVYEFARYKGYFGDSVDKEEEYLLRISDKGGESSEQLNLTDYPYFIVQSWVRCIYIAAIYNWHKEKNIPPLPLRKLIYGIFQTAPRRGPGFDAQKIFCHPIIYHLRYIAAPLFVIRENYRSGNRKLFMERCMELIGWPFRRRYFTKYAPLREFLRENLKQPRDAAENSIYSLRMGR